MRRAAAATPFGGIEAGGTKWVCAVGTSPDDIRAHESFPTTTPAETIGRAIAFFRANGPVSGLGVGSFGPIELRHDRPLWGHITSTPKDGWRNTDVLGPLGEALAVPIGFDTDVNAAALGEQRWGAAQGLDTFSYVTVGTGIGGGGMANGALLHGQRHPEVGHMRIPHDLARDPFPGVCPYHSDCLEGLASGTAMRARWGAPADTLEADEVWELEARYLALGLTNLIATCAPLRIVIGGGVLAQPRLLPLIRAEVVALSAGYFDLPEAGDGMDAYIVAPALGSRSGVVGALELGRNAAAR